MMRCVLALTTLLLAVTLVASAQQQQAVARTSNDDRERVLLVSNDADAAVVDTGVEDAEADADEMTAEQRAVAELREHMPADDAPTSHEIDAEFATKTHTHPAYGIGAGHGWNLDGRSGKEFILHRGKTYRFRVRSLCSNKLYLSSSSRGAGDARILHGVSLSNEACADGVLSFTPDETHPNVVYYQSESLEYTGARLVLVPLLPASASSLVAPLTSLLVAVLVTLTLLA